MAYWASPESLDETSELLASNYDKSVDCGKDMLAMTMIHQGMLWLFPASEALIRIGLNLI